MRGEHRIGEGGSGMNLLWLQINFARFQAEELLFAIEAVGGDLLDSVKKPPEISMLISDGPLFCLSYNW